MYSEWHQRVLRRYAEKQPEFGAIWLTYYPNIMVVVSAHVLVVSVAVPKGPGKTTVITGLLPEDIVWFGRNSSRPSRRRTSKPPSRTTKSATACTGPQALAAAVNRKSAPYQSPTEDGMQHFHEFYRRKMGEALRG